MEPSPFADAARRAFGDASEREIAGRAHVSQTTIHNMLMGMVPSRRLLIQVADALALESERRTELFRTAGYVDPAAMFDPDAAFNDGIRQLREEFGVDFQVSTEEIWLARQSPEQIEQMLAAFRARLEERRKRG